MAAALCGHQALGGFTGMRADNPMWVSPPTGNQGSRCCRQELRSRPQPPSCWGLGSSHLHPALWGFICCCPEAHTCGHWVLGLGKRVDRRKWCCGICLYKGPVGALRCVWGCMCVLSMLYVHMCVGAHTHICVHTEVDARCLPHTNWISPIRPDWLASKLKGSSFVSAWYCHTQLFVGLGNLNTGPHSFTASTVPTEPSPREPPLTVSWDRVASAQAEDGDPTLQILLPPYTKFWGYRPQYVPPCPEGALML